MGIDIVRHLLQSTSGIARVVSPDALDIALSTLRHDRPLSLVVDSLDCPLQHLRQYLVAHGFNTYSMPVHAHGLLA